MINLHGLDEAGFRQTMAHELLHHWWTHFKKFEKLKWKVIRKQLLENELADKLHEGTQTSTSNLGCSAGPSHERHNPEHKKVCADQSKY